MTATKTAMILNSEPPQIVNIPTESIETTMSMNEEGIFEININNAIPINKIKANKTIDPVKPKPI
jgi:hypothetical protein